MYSTTWGLPCPYPSSSRRLPGATIKSPPPGKQFPARPEEAKHLQAGHCLIEQTLIHGFWNEEKEEQEEGVDTDRWRWRRRNSCRSYRCRPQLCIPPGGSLPGTGGWRRRPPRRSARSGRRLWRHTEKRGDWNRRLDTGVTSHSTCRGDRAPASI